MLGLRRAGRAARLLVLLVCAVISCGDDDGGSDAGSSDGATHDGGSGGKGGSVAPPGDAGGETDAASGDDGGARDAGLSPDGGGGTDAGPTEPCGDGVVDGDETCDVGITSGSGECPASCDDGDACTADTLRRKGTCEAACEHEDITSDEDGDGCCRPGRTGQDDDDCPPTRLDLSVDPDDLSPELGTTHTLTVTLAASDGFAGDVQLQATVVDADDAELTSWVVALADDALSVPEDGVVTTDLTITIPTQRATLAATVTVVATSDAMAGASEASASFDLLDRITIPVLVNELGECAYPPAGSTYVKIGTTVRWLNVDSDPTGNITIHVDPNDVGCAHQPDPGSPPGGAYQCTFTGSTSGDPFSWYCHAPGPNVGDRQLVPVN